MWASSIGLAALLFVACGGGSSSHGSAPTSTSTVSTSTFTSTRAVSTEDANLTAADFKNVNDYTRVGDHFVRTCAAISRRRSRWRGRRTAGAIPSAPSSRSCRRRRWSSGRAGFNPSDGRLGVLLARRVGARHQDPLRAAPRRCSTASATVARRATVPPIRSSISCAAPRTAASRCRSGLPCSSGLAANPIRDPADRALRRRDDGACPRVVELARGPCVRSRRRHAAGAAPCSRRASSAAVRLQRFEIGRRVG